MNIQSNHRMAARLRACPIVQEMMRRNAFGAEAAVDVILDLNEMSDDYRRILVEGWCQTHATGRWRRRVVERRGHALLDKIVLEFEHVADAIALRGWLMARGW